MKKILILSVFVASLMGFHCGYFQIFRQDHFSDIEKIKNDVDHFTENNTSSFFIEEAQVPPIAYKDPSSFRLQSSFRLLIVVIS